MESIITTLRWSPTQPEDEIIEDTRVFRIGQFGLTQRRFSPLQDLERLRKWISIIRSTRPDLVHVHGPFSPIVGIRRWSVSCTPIGLMQALGWLGAPVVVTFHGLWAHYEGADRYDRDWKHVELGSFFIAVDQQIARDLSARYGVPKGRIENIPNGVDSKIFKPGRKDPILAAELGIPQSAPVVLVPRRIEPKNGIELAVRAFAQVAREVDDARMILVGFELDTSDREYARTIRRLIHEVDLDSRIVCHKGFSHDEMPRVFNLADLTVIPSLWEATSLAAIESLASGVPVIATNLGGLPDVVDDGSGILVPPGRVEPLADAIGHLLSNSRERQRLSAGAIQRAKAFDWSRIADRTYAVYQRASAELSRVGA